MHESLAPTELQPEITTTTITDEGTVCVNDAGEVEVTFPGCLSSRCDTLVSATCTAVLEGETVVVHAEAVIESQGEECTADCVKAGGASESATECSFKRLRHIRCLRQPHLGERGVRPFQVLPGAATI